MKTKLAFVVLFTVLMIGCNNKEDQLQEQLDSAQDEAASLQQGIAERDKYFEDVMRAVNEVYMDLEKARINEGQLAQRAEGVEGTAHLTNAETRQKLLQNINAIGSALKENRKKIADLQVRVKSLGGKMASLNTFISSLKNSLHEREQSIAQLEAKVQGLEVTVAEKTKVIAEKEGVIDEQQTKLNTVFYVVGTRDELEKKGLITNEGGFLWGLIGSTTLMASGVDQSDFTPIDRTKDQVIHVNGRIEEILPHRNPDFFATNEEQDGSRSDLAIVSPDRFWQDDYLVIVID